MGQRVRLAGPFTCRRQPGQLTCHVTYTNAVTWSHTWGVQIAFSRDLVSRTVGYEVSRSGTHEVSYESDYEPGYRAYIVKDPWYYVTEFTAWTRWLPGVMDPWEEVGPGWAAEWFADEISTELVPT